MPLIIPSNTITGGYEVDNSLRFDDGSSDYLSRTNQSSITDNKIFTMSTWLKRSGLGFNQDILHAQVDASNLTQIGFGSTGEHFIIYNLDGGASNLYLKTTAKYRDCNAWYHLMAVVDTTQATSTDRAKLYVNGELITALDQNTYPSQNAVMKLNLASTNQYVGTYGATQYYFDGYMAEVCFIDGTALDPTSFGEFDEDSGIWKPKNVSGLTFGTNGFYLPFENSAALGQDDSGNGNNFTVNNLTSIDQTTDTPTNNFATWNALNSNGTLSEGNLECVISTTDRWGSSGTFGISQSKWYWECKAVAKTGGTGLIMIGIEGDPAERDRNTTYSGSTDTGYSYYGSDLYFYNGSAFSYGDAYDTNDIIGVALDLDNNKLYFSKNGVWQNSGDPESGGTGTGAISITDPNSQPTGFYFPSVGDGSTTTGHTVASNFGNPSFTISSGNSDANGYGNFEYSVPSGYYALCTKNLAEYG